MSKLPTLHFHFYAVTPGERIITLSRTAKDERGARAKVRRSKYGRSLRSLRLERVSSVN